MLFALQTKSVLGMTLALLCGAASWWCQNSILNEAYKDAKIMMFVAVIVGLLSGMTSVATQLW